MIKKIKNINVNYIQYGIGKDVVLLHGWGQNVNMMDPLGKNLEDSRITIIDLPGFGSSEEPDFAYNISDYASLVHELLESMEIKNPILIGHSFGGRVAICYASMYSVNKLVLFGSPFKVNNCNNSLKVRVLKKLKNIKILNSLAEYMKNYIGSRDYKAASGIMREILVNTVNTDLSECAKKIKIPTILIWGDNDTEASIEEAKELENLINDASLITLKGTHYCYLENLGHVSNILNEFFRR